MIQEDNNLKKLKLYMDKILKNDIYKNRNIDCCPACGSKTYIKHGSYNGIQRYKCRDCGKTFSNTTNSLWGYSKKSSNLWFEFLELMLERKSLRFCAEKLDISLGTAFYWRHKILHALSFETTPNSLKGVIYIGKIIVKENFKGCRKIKANSGSNRRKNIWILGAIGQEDSMFVKPVFKDFWDWKVFNEKIYTKIEKNSFIVPYGDRYISLAAQKHNKKSHKKVKDDDRIKFFVLNYEKWFSNFHGIASKYLQRYASLFILFNLNKVLDYINIMNFSLFFGNKFLKTSEIRNIENYIY